MNGNRVLNRVFCGVLYAIMIALLVTVTARAADIKFVWDSYTSEADGFYLYMAAAPGVQPIAANRVATITPRTMTAYTLANVSPGTKYFVLTTYLGSLESIPSNEISTIVKLPAPSGLSAEVIAAIVQAGGSK
jgi:hypothetical protein